MSEILKTLIFPLFIAIAVSTITPYMTVMLSRKQFRSQRYWEKKSEIYSNVIEQLSNLIYYYEEWANLFEMYGYPGLSNKKSNDLAPLYKDAYNTFMKVSNSGIYIMSEDVIKELEEVKNILLVETDSADWLDDAFKTYDELKKILIKLKKLIKKDLSI